MQNQEKKKKMKIKKKKKHENHLSKKVLDYFIKDWLTYVGGDKKETIV
jgi:hypothetical protein